MTDIQDLFKNVNSKDLLDRYRDRIKSESHIIKLAYHMQNDGSLILVTRDTGTTLISPSILLAMIERFNAHPAIDGRFAQDDKGDLRSIAFKTNFLAVDFHDGVPHLVACISELDSAAGNDFTALYKAGMVSIIPNVNGIQTSAYDATMQHISISQVGLNASFSRLLTYLAKS